ncbi:YbhB/YbcL family Raf kinase inhibitor-like protein [Actinomadura sp. WMMB 499]|uniref:YbhB/YbcL family Raf kinase inhibitor-like protein n=1 Tax=Actinomadura sp. WMMB 499 TaxID=1219491 RepID=UPI0012468B4D|nr:YbhB/YbcL family Raf kinase inhibitor-like protein [Actinomadura sp. WMMB 499]QFG26629.1 YbhB/YbcL family Raf kinase inhibitor-like protein [Actinomadura sp. WMMB 499]
MKEMTLRSRAFDDHTIIPSDYSHDGGDLSPPLEWSEAPEEVVELTLACEDPDAPSGTFAHWLVAGIDPVTTGLDPGERPTGAILGRNDYGAEGYGGPKPPAGDDPHRYFFRLYGLAEPTGLGTGFTAEDLRDAMQDKIVASGTLVGTFAR